MTPDPPFGRILLIQWLDAETIGDTGWTDLDSARESARQPPPIMKTIGFVVHTCSTHIAITDSLGMQECGHVTKIPREMIKTLDYYDSDQQHRGLSKEQSKYDDNNNIV